ncbi:hypothetical protein B566_EDAN009110 [Ephemera danica]|nr:hypothetical protein B566_EDAN009110 [Ephemera danica]
MLYEKIRKRCVTHETISFIGSPPPPPPPPPSPLQTCDFVDLLPRSLSSPASPAPDLLSLELVQRRNRSNAGRRTKPAVPKMTIRKPNPRLLDALVSQASVPKVVRSDLQMSSKLHSKMISVPKKEVPAPATSAVTATTSTVPETKTHEQLSVIHRKKLLWATSQAIKSTFPELSSDSGTLKRNVSALFRLCLTQWLLVRNDAHDAGKGTSERMLELATRLAPNVVNSL